MKGNGQVIIYLLNHPKIHHDAINERDVNGDTPLHLASRELRLLTLFFLLGDKRIDVNLVNNKGLTALDVVWIQRKIPESYQELLARVILYRAGVDLKANMLSVPLTRSINKEWNVKDAANTLILVAILIATLTFAAGFTVPGGLYSADSPIPKQRGMALLADQTLFKIFMAFNTIALYSSTIGSIILLWVPMGDGRLATLVYMYARLFVHVALIAMPVAFLAAIRLIVSNNTIVADVISVIGFISIFLTMFIRILGFLPLGSRRPVLKQIIGLFLWIRVVLVYGGDDAWQSNYAGEDNQVDQDDAKNQIK
ncbi:protein ACCELERATED CELL DEATH 6-like [Neltuma alba]|uniref:protein ACCELERATED CELL DEATH 6-like n=1 Tax=Neltuma alba TaxID=207710 RepID=UPI0010A2C24B|nr:protein ACCELERATED CELL DEATH 6-like [Prosopis alba]